MNLASIIIVALIGEALWETLKLIWQNGKVSFDRVGAILIGLFLAFGTRLDMMQIIGIPFINQYAGEFLTGLLISRGANFMHDLLGSVNNMHVNTKQGTQIQNNNVQDK
jgi:hypothetical protein